MDRAEQPFQFATNVATTNAFCSMSVDSAAVRAVDKLSKLFDNRVSSGRANARAATVV